MIIYKNYILSPNNEVWRINKKFCRRLEPVLYHSGYLYVTLCDKGESDRRSLHQIIAKARIPNPENLPVVRHKNDIRTDNRVENLAWGTYQDNSDDAVTNGSMPKGEAHHNSKLLDEEVSAIRRLNEHSWTTHRMIAKMFGVSQPYVSQIVNNKRRRA